MHYKLKSSDITQEFYIERTRLSLILSKFYRICKKIGVAVGIIASFYLFFATASVMLAIVNASIIAYLCRKLIK